jgi:hypothetical protein
MIRIALIIVVCVLAYLFYKEAKKYFGIIKAREEESISRLKNKELGIKSCTAFMEERNDAMKETLEKTGENDVPTEE